MSYTNTTGYTRGTETEKNNINIIPSSKITMKDVDKALTLIPVINGKPQYNKKIIAKPGDDDIDFGPEVTSVIEIPMAQSQWGVIGDTTDSFDTNNWTKKNPYNVPGTSQALFEQTKASGNNFIKTPFSNLTKPQSNIGWEQTPQTLTKATTMGQTGDPTSGTSSQEKPADQYLKRLSAMNPYGDIDTETAMTMSGIGFGLAQHGQTPGQKGWGTVMGIAGLGKGVLGSLRNFSSGFAQSKRYNEEKAEMERKRMEAMQEEGTYDSMVGVPGQVLKKGGFIDFMQKGGITSPKQTLDPRMLTGNYLEGNDNHPDPNAELERGEYVRTPEGQSMEITGKKHSEGGELLNLPVDTKIISDYLKIGATNAKDIQKLFDIKVSAGSSFATVVDKYRKSIGLTTLLEDEEEIIKKIAAQEQITNENTKDLNYKVLSKRLVIIQQQKEPLEEKLTEFVDFVFEVQEEHKEEKGITADNNKKQEGGQTTSSNPEEAIMAFAEMHGVDPQEIIAELEGLDENEQQVMLTEIMQAVRTTPPTQEQGQPDVEQIIMAFAEQQGVDPQEIIKELQSLSPEEQQQAIQEMTGGEQPAASSNPEEIIMAFAEMQGVDPQEIVGQLEGLGPEEQQQAIQEMGNAVSGEQPPQMQDGGIIYAQDGALMKPEDWETNYLKKWQHEPVTPEGVRYSFEEKQYQPARFSYLHGQEFTPENLHQGLIQVRGDQLINERPQSTNYILKTEATRRELGAMAKADPSIKKELEKNGVVFIEDKDFGLVAKKGVTSEAYTKEQKEKIANAKQTFYQNNTDDVTFPALALGLNDKEEYYRGHATKEVEFDSQDALDAYLKDKKWKKLSNGAYETDKTGLYFKPVVKKPGSTSPDNSQSPTKDLQGANNDMLMMPHQLPGRWNLPPNLLMPTLRQTRAFQADPLAISPNSTLRENSRSVQAQQQMLQSMDPSLAAGNIGNLTAEEMTANSAAIEKANMANQADRRQVDSLNEGRQEQALNTNLAQQGVYEQTAQTALQNFYDENRNYITKQNNDNIENWNLQNKISAYNAANPNYKMMSDGTMVQTGKPFYFADSGKPVENNTAIHEDEKGKFTIKDGKKIRLVEDKTVPSVDAVKSKKGGKISFSNFMKNK